MSHLKNKTNKGMPKFRNPTWQWLLANNVYSQTPATAEPALRRKERWWKPWMPKRSHWAPSTTCLSCHEALVAGVGEHLGYLAIPFDDSVIKHGWRTSPKYTWGFDWDNHLLGWFPGAFFSDWGRTPGILHPTMSHQHLCRRCHPEPNGSNLTISHQWVSYCTS
jgi:hypothetical protein